MIKSYIWGIEVKERKRECRYHKEEKRKVFGCLWHKIREEKKKNCSSVHCLSKEWLRWISRTFSWLGEFGILFRRHTRTNIIQDLMNGHLSIPITKGWNSFWINLNNRKNQTKETERKSNTNWTIRCNTGQINSSLKTNGRRFIRISIPTMNFQCIDSTFIRGLNDRTASCIEPSRSILLELDQWSCRPTGIETCHHSLLNPMRPI